MASLSNDFALDDIREIFAQDLAAFVAVTRDSLTRYASAEGAPDDLAEPVRAAHSMKGVAAMIRAWGLSWLGEDIETLYEVAHSFHHSERTRALSIALFILGELPRWQRMTEATLADDFAAACALYFGFRAEAEKRYAGYLPERSEQPEPAGEFTRLKPAAGVAGAARRAAAPRFLVAEDPPEAGGPALAESLKPAVGSAGLARKAAAPKFQIAEESADAPPAEESATVKPAATAAGAARQAVAPHFKVADENAPAPAADETALLTPAAAAAGAARQVSVPHFKIAAEETLAPTADESSSVKPVASAAGTARHVSKPALHVAEEIPQTAATAPGIDPDLARAFVLDAQDQLEKLERALLAWERGENSEAARDAAYRAVHTLKGAANSIGLSAVGENLHAVEALFELTGHSAAAPANELFTFLLGTVDQLRKFSAALDVDPATPWTLDWRPTVAALSSRPTAPAPTPPPAAPQTREETDADLIRAVALDLRDQSAVIESAVLGWERGEDAAAHVGAAYRACHTLKGASNSVGLRRLGADFHALETLLDSAARADAPTPAPDLVAFLLAAADQLAAYSTALERNPDAAWPHAWSESAAPFAARFGQDAAAPAAAVPDDDTSPVSAGTIRVDVSRIHKLMNQVGELVVERNRFAAKLERAITLRQLLGSNRQRLVRLVETFQDQFEYSSSRQRPGSARTIVPFPAGAAPAGAAEDFSDIEFDRYDEFNMLSRQVTEVADDLGQVTVELERLIETFRKDEHRFATNSKVMQEDITRLTSQPIDTLFRRLDRIFRDAVQGSKKDAVLRFEGAGTTLDRSIIERLYTPLLHLVRNAVAHGIEAPEHRVAAGKTRAGTVVLGATQSANQILLTIRDDGCGIDPARVLALAKERGVIGPEVAELTPEQVLHTIFTPGFSTASEVTSIAGRGIGLDVVKNEIEAMNGSVTAEWTPGRGTTWKLLLPLTLAVTEAIIVGLGSEEFAIPLNFTESGILLSPDQVRVRDGAEYYALGADEVRLVRLASLFGLGGDTHAPCGVIVIAGDSRLVLAVDRVPARREIVVKGFDPLLAKHPLLEGATLNAEGRPVLILNVPAVLRLAAGAVLPALSSVAAAPARERSAGERLAALVVDDSLSVRTVQERLLSDLGCEVILANDGLDAIEKLRAHRVDIIFTDLEMPRMNGYDLISTVRLNPRWSALPIVLVTSRTGQKHLDKAMHLGCTDFLLKPFTQDDLAKTLTQHTGGAVAAVA